MTKTEEPLHAFDVCVHCGFASCSCVEKHFPRECPNCLRDKFTGRAVIKKAEPVFS